MKDYPIPAPKWKQGTTEHTDPRNEREANEALTRIEESRMLRDQIDHYNRCAADNERRYDKQPLDLTRDWESETRPDWSELGFIVVVGVIFVGILVSLLFQSSIGRWIA